MLRRLRREPIQAQSMDGETNQETTVGDAPKDLQKPEQDRALIRLQEAHAGKLLWSPPGP